MFCNYVTLKRNHVKRDEYGPERIASRHGDLTNFHAAEPERLEIGARESAYEVASGARAAYSRGVFTHLASVKVHFPRPRHEDYDRLRKRRSAKQKRAKKKTAGSYTPTPKSAIVIEDLDEM